MKTTLIPRIIRTVVFAVVLATPAHAADPITDHLQQGLLEEEVNRDLEAAVRAYETAVSHFDSQRKIAATAVFRLAECHRKLGRAQEAIALYRRVQTEFADQATLADLSRTHLARLGVQPVDDPLTSPSDPTTPRISAEDAEEIARLRDLLENSPDLTRGTLQSAAYAGKLAVVRFLLDSGLDVNGSPPGQSPLHYAALKGYKAVAELLIERGADVNAQANGQTPLHHAARNGHKGVAELLLEHAADVNAQASSGATPLHLATSQGHLLVLQTLLAAEPELNIVTQRKDEQIEPGMTPLSLAIRRQSLPMVQALLDAGADANVRNQYERTPLHYAVEGAEPKLIELLLDHGAEPNPVDNEGATPLDLAVKAGAQPDVIQLLRDRGAVSNPANDQK